mmetsp:Transcript_99491/g.264425  ORF Transcript_99491/g.264425 Transcript_99491/m.264425 type:complete len:107 (-) Transcript_99491:91-411(-)
MALFCSRALQTGVKSKRMVVQLLSSAQTGFAYWTEKSPLKKEIRMALHKFDPIVNRHVMFYETVISRPPRRARRIKALAWARWTGSSFIRNFVKRVQKKHETKGYF